MLDLLLAILGILATLLIGVALVLALLAAFGAVFAGELLERVTDWLVRGRRTGIGAEGVVGCEARVTREFEALQGSDRFEGSVIVGDERWTARASTPLPVGSLVTIEDVDGLTLRVRPL